MTHEHLKEQISAGHENRALLCIYVIHAKEPLI